MTKVLKEDKKRLVLRRARKIMPTINGYREIVGLSTQWTGKIPQVCTTRKAGSYKGREKEVYFKCSTLNRVPSEESVMLYVPENFAPNELGGMFRQK